MTEIRAADALAGLAPRGVASDPTSAAGFALHIPTDLQLGVSRSVGSLGPLPAPLPLEPGDSPLQGQRPIAADGRLFDIARAVTASRADAGAWTRVDDAELRARGIDPASLRDPASGFEAAVYGDANGNVVVGFAGTNGGSMADIRTNAQQALGNPGGQTRQFALAADLATDVKAAYGEALVGLTGMSLGGALAALASATVDVPAVTFNAAGLADSTYANEGLDPSAAHLSAAQGMVRRYVVGGEAVAQFMQSSMGRSLGLTTPGVPIVLRDPSPDDAPLRFRVGEMDVGEVLHGFGLHGPRGIQQSLDRAPPRPAGQSADLPSRSARP